MDEIPLLKRARLTEVIHVRVEKPVADEIRILRARFGLDANELVRAFLRNELPKIKKKLEPAS